MYSMNFCPSTNVEWWLVVYSVRCYMISLASYLENVWVAPAGDEPLSVTEVTVVMKLKVVSTSPPSWNVEFLVRKLADVPPLPKVPMIWSIWFHSRIFNYLCSYIDAPPLAAHYGCEWLNCQNCYLRQLGSI